VNKISYLKVMMEKSTASGMDTGRKGSRFLRWLRTFPGPM